MQFRILQLLQGNGNSLDTPLIQALQNTRVIASSSRPLAELVERGLFHAGLYHLLSSFMITLPPLRERIDDIPILAHEFAMHFASEERLGHILGITAQAMEHLKAYSWPDNVRELKNAVYHAVLRCDDGMLTLSDFRQVRAEAQDRSASTAAEMLTLDASPSAFSGVTPDGQVRTLAAAEEDMIRFAVSHYDGQISEVARRLGIGRTTLYRKLKEYGIDVASLSTKLVDDVEIDEVILQKGA